MAIAASAGAQIIVATSAKLALTNTDIATLVYQDIGTSYDINGIVLDVSSGSIVDGTPDGIYTTGEGVINDAAQSDTNEFIIWLFDGSGDAISHAVKVARSGDTLTPTELTWDEDDPGGSNNGFISATTNGNKAVIIRTFGVAGPYFGYNSVDLITNAVAEMVTQNDGLEGDDVSAMAIAGMDSDDLMAMFSLASDGSLYFQMVNASVGISQGTSNDSTINTAGTYNYPLKRFDDNKAIALVEISSAMKALTVNRSGSSISSYGTPLTVLGSVAPTVFDIASSKLIVAKQTDTQEITVSVYSVTGDTITDDSNSTTLAMVNDNLSSIVGLVVTSSDKGVLVWKEADGFLYGSVISGFSSVSYDLTHSSGGIPGAILEVTP